MVWKKGQSGNPAGRPKGARDKLSQAVYEEMIEDWAEHGSAVIEKVRESKPELYLQAVIRLVPASHHVDLNSANRSLSEIPNDEIGELLKAGKAA